MGPVRIRLSHSQLGFKLRVSRNDVAIFRGNGLVTRPPSLSTSESSAAFSLNEGEIFRENGLGGFFAMPHCVYPMAISAALSLGAIGIFSGYGICGFAPMPHSQSTSGISVSFSLNASDILRGYALSGFAPETP